MGKRKAERNEKGRKRKWRVQNIKKEIKLRSREKIKGRQKIENSLKKAP
jgi:hypothetical protein